MIARAVDLARSLSSTVSIATLVGFNLVPLVGVLFWQWNVSTLLILYWLENGVVGVLNVAKILLAAGPPPTAASATLRINGRPTASRGLVAVFFLVHYGLFWFVHAVFVLTLPMFFGNSTDPFRAAPEVMSLSPDLATAGAPGPSLAGIGLGLLALTISHGVSFLVNYLGRREYLNVSPQEQAMAPYGRLVILHMAIILGAFVSLAIGSPVGAVIVLVLLKTIVDVQFHRQEHRRLSGAPPGPLFG